MPYWLSAALDALQLSKDIALAVVIALVACLMLVSLYWKRISDYLRSQREAARRMQAVYLAMVDPDIKLVENQEPVLISFAELRTEQRASRELVSEKCGSSSCPVVPIVMQRLDRTEDALKRLAVVMDKILEQQVHGFEKLHERLTTWNNEVGTQMLMTIRNGMSKKTSTE